MAENIANIPLPEVNTPAKLVKMTFNIPYMNQEENTERSEREERYRISQDDVSIIRKEVNLLTSAVGDLKIETTKVVEAIQGNKFGNKGLIERITQVEQMGVTLNTRVEEVNARIEKIIANAKSRETYVRIIWGLICFVVGTLFVAVIDRIIPSSKK
jgi:hypothetical protein